MSSLRQQSLFAHASCQSSARLSGKQCFAQGSEPRIAVRQPLARIAVLLSQEAVTRHTPMLYLHQQAGPLKEGLDSFLLPLAISSVISSRLRTGGVASRGCGFSASAPSDGATLPRCSRSLQQTRCPETCPHRRQTMPEQRITHRQNSYPLRLLITYNVPCNLSEP